MSFYDHLMHETDAARNEFLAIPILRDGVAGRIDRTTYLAFLAQAYHHVRHTAPLLMQCGARLPGRLAWLREAVAHYIAEEIGHDAWILDDIRAAGGDPDKAREAPPLPATEIMVAYAYDTVQRRHPAGMFGMVLVLEGTSVSLATKAAEEIRANLGLPDAAFTYLASHGELDKEHMAFFRRTIDRLTEREDQAAVIEAARMFYRLYGDIFRALSSLSVAA